jgi:SAM-dependent methyltransferase
VSAYDAIARLYDPWSRSVVEDVGFYVEEAVRCGGPVLELGVGTGRIAVPTALAGIEVVGVDRSAGMLEVAREAAELAGVAIDLRQGDLREPPVEAAFPLVTIPFRSLLHMESDEDRRAALRAVRARLAPGGRFVFDVFSPGADDIADTHGQWLEREPGIWERADWDEEARTLILRVRGPEVETEMSLAWLSVGEWRALLLDEGFEVESLYGWFDRAPWHGDEDSVWICRAADDAPRRSSAVAPGSALAPGSAFARSSLTQAPSRIGSEARLLLSSAAYEGRQVAAKARRIVPTRSVSRAGVDEKLGTGDQAYEAVLHLTGDQAVGVTPDQQRRRLDEREFGLVVVLEQVRERLLPDASRDGEDLVDEQVDEIGRDSLRGCADNERPCEAWTDRIVQIPDDGLDETE